MMEHFDALVTDPAVKLADVEAHPAALTGNERFRGRCWVAATPGTTGQRGIFLWAWTSGSDPRFLGVRRVLLLTSTLGAA